MEDSPPTPTLAPANTACGWSPTGPVAAVRVHCLAALLLAVAWPLIASAAEPGSGEWPPRPLVTHFFRPGPGLAELQTVIGTSQSYTVEVGDTFLDIARRHDVGYNELVDANPGIDPWVPAPGEALVVPAEWILPRTEYEGLVLNIPEMRFYYYLPSPRREARSSMVLTYPVGLGRRDWQTPQADFRIRGKTPNPTWVIPESIKRERRRELGRTEASIPGGHPDNPLGAFRIELTLPSYAIHGTNKEWGIGMQVSHGCVRMYPEDIEAFFPVVSIGAPGRFVYQPVKVGMRGGRVLVEVHEDIYGVAPWPWLSARELVDDMGLSRYVDPKRLEAVVGAASGIPTDVSYVSWPAPATGEPVEFDQQGDPLKPYPEPPPS